MPSHHRYQKQDAPIKSVFDREMHLSGLLLTTFRVERMPENIASRNPSLPQISSLSTLEIL